MSTQGEHKSIGSSKGKYEAEYEVHDKDNQKVVSTEMEISHNSLFEDEEKSVKKLYAYGVKTSMQRTELLGMWITKVCVCVFF